MEEITKRLLGVRKKTMTLWLLAWVLVVPRFSNAQSIFTTLSLLPSTVLTTFKPLDIFGVNTGYWAENAKVNNMATVSKVQAAGNFLTRYPGGSKSDDYHWNGTGSFDSNGWWTPSNTSFSAGWDGLEKFRGTSSTSYSTAAYLTDGDLTTRWLSNKDTDFPNAQWVYVDLGSPKSANAVSLIWNFPYATSFKVQYWNGPLGYPPPYAVASNAWVDTSAGTTGGIVGTPQVVSFFGVTSQYFRILMTASSNIGPAQYSMSELYVLNGSTLLTVNTKTATYPNPPDQSNTTASSTDPAATVNYYPDFDFESFMDYCHSFSPNAIPIITTNFGTGTPQEAAAWVHYANVVKGYGIKYWEIGNEIHGVWETGGPLSAKDYARRYIEFYQAMKAEDPSIMVLGPVTGQPDAPSNDYDGKTHIQGFVDRLAADPGGNKAAYAEGIDFHWYPTFNSTDDALDLSTPSQFATIASNMTSWLVNHPAPSTVPVFMTEFNSGNAMPFTEKLPSGLWLADTMGQFVRNFGPRGFSTFFTNLAGMDPAGGDFGYLQNDSGPYQFQERAAYWAMNMMTNYWALPGDSRSHQLVSCVVNSGPSSLLTAYADKRPDGVLSLMVVNKDPANSYYGSLTSGFLSNTQATGWTFDPSNYNWDTSSTPFHANPDNPPSPFTISGVSGSYPVTFKPYSLTVLQFTDATLPTNTPTATPTITSTPTVTSTPQALVIDDFEDGDNRTTLPQFGGFWFSGQDACGSTPVSTVFNHVPGEGGSLYSLQVTGSRAANQIKPTPTPNCFTFANAGADLKAPSTDFNASGFLGIQFWFYGDGNSYRFDVKTSDVADFDWLGFNFTPPIGWNQVQVPFTALSQQGFGMPVAFNPAHVRGVQFDVMSAPANFNFQVDLIRFYTAGAALPTATASPTPTPPSSPSFTPTRTYTFTPTATFSYTPTWTLSPSPTLTATTTPSFSPTFTGTPTSTPAVSGTLSPTDSMTATSSFTPTLTPTWSTTSTSTPTFSMTTSATPSSTSTASPTPTMTPLGVSLTPTPTAGIILITPEPPIPHRFVTLWPNPLREGDQMRIQMVLPASGNVTVRIFTLSQRKVVEQTFADVPAGGSSLTVSLRDPRGAALGNGLYFVQVISTAGRQVTPLLILR